VAKNLKLKKATAKNRDLKFKNKKNYSFVYSITSALKVRLGIENNIK